MKKRNEATLRFYIRIFVLLMLLNILFLGSAGQVTAYSANLSLTVIHYSSTYTAVVLNWEDAKDETGYKIERRVDSGTYDEKTPLATVSAGSTAYTDAGVQPGHVYTYRVSWKDSADNWTIYTPEAATTIDTVNRPDSLTISAASPTSMNLVWTYPNGASYDTQIDRSVDGSSWTTVKIVSKGTNSYNDISLNSSTSYYYRIRAVSGDFVHSLYYPSDSGQGSTTALEAPSDLTGYADVNGGLAKIYLSWTYPSTESGIIIERKEGMAGDYQVAEIISAGRNTWIDPETELKSDTKYIYRIKAINGSLESEYSNEVVINTVSLNAPSGLTASASSGSSIKLKWLDASNAETGFEIWKKAGAVSKWELCDTVERNVSEYDDTNVTSNTSYCYKVRAIKAHSNVYSAFSNEVVVWTIIPGAPTELQYSLVSPTQVRLNWKDNSSSESGFSIERRKGLDEKWQEIAQLASDSVSFSDNGLTDSIQYFYRVKIYDRSFYNSYAYSEEIAVSTKMPDTPSNLKAQSLSRKEIKLAWDYPSNGVTGFEIARYVEDIGLDRVFQADAGTRAYIDHDLQPGTTYKYRIHALNGAGQGRDSNTAVAVTKTNLTFSDVPDSYWAADAINNLASRKVISGKGNGKFYPEDKVTRGEYISMLVKAFELKAVAVGSFADVTSHHPYYKEIMIASKLGLTSQSLKGYFYPNRYITREELAVFTVRALKAIQKPLADFDISVLEGFSDKGSIAAYARYDIAALCGERIIAGRQDGPDWIIAPKDHATRAEAATVISKIIDR